MAQILAGDIRKGITFEYKSGVYTVVEFLHVKPGKGAAFVRAKLKNVVTGQVLEDTFNPTAKLETVDVQTTKMTYSYFDGEFYVFADEEYNETRLTADQVGDTINWIKEMDTVTIKFLYGNAFSVEAENFVELVVTQADPGVKGNTATNVMKNAVLETGARIMVPMFIEEGETIRVDTRTGEYMARVK